MTKLKQLLVFLVVSSFLLLPIPTYALGLSFGGPIIALLPCANGAIWITIVPDGGDLNPFYIWTPATLTFLAGPPVSEGQEILGVADIPYVCYIPPHTFLYGERMQIEGDSPL